METKYQSIVRKQNKEQELFVYFAQHKQINRYDFTPLSSSYDAKMLSGNTWCQVEIKNREDRDIAFFSKYGPFLELKKIQGMYDEQKRIKEEKGIETQMLYFNFTSDGIQIFYLYEPWNYNFNWKYLPKDNYNLNIKEWKLVAELRNPEEILIKTNK